MTHTVEAYKVYYDTKNGRLPFTYLVFGPYSHGEFDVEVHRGHVDDNMDPETYLFTESDLPRNTHICADMWNAMDEFVANYPVEV